MKRKSPIPRCKVGHAIAGSNVAMKNDKEICRTCRNHSVRLTMRKSRKTQMPPLQPPEAIDLVIMKKVLAAVKEVAKNVRSRPKFVTMVSSQIKTAAMLSEQIGRNL
jgi:hypothetical protein